MIGVRLILVATAAGLAFCAPANAETLKIHGIYPAENSGAAPLSSIAVQQFGGIDGPALSIKISDALRDARIDGQSYFSVGPASVMRGADAVMTGTVSTDVRTSRSGSKEVSRCVKRDDKRNCVERRKVKVRCEQLNLSVRPTLRLIGPEGDMIHSENAQSTRQVRFCEGERQPSIEPLVEQSLDEIAQRVRFSLAPQQRVENIRILESRSGMARADSRAFKDAIRMTKSDEGVACDAFAALEPSVGEHVSLLFNLGLCAEARGDFTDAGDYYRRAIASDPSKSHAGDGLARLRQRERAEEQLAEHYGS